MNIFEFMLTQIGFESRGIWINLNYVETYSNSLNQFEVAKEDESALENIDCLFSLDDIDQALNHIAEKLNQRFSGRPLLVLNVLQGGTLTTTGRTYED